MPFLNHILNPNKIKTLQPKTFFNPINCKTCLFFIGITKPFKHTLILALKVLHLLFGLTNLNLILYLIKLNLDHITNTQNKKMVNRTV
jgi:hypothetical protein